MSTFPEHLAIERCVPMAMQPFRAVESRSGFVQRTTRSVHYWLFDIEMAPVKKRDYRLIMAFFESQRAGQESFEIVIPDSEGLGTRAGAPVVKNSHVAGDRSIKTRGWYKNSRVLLSGDLVRIKNKVYCVTENATSNASGETTMQINPGLMQAASDGEGIVAKGLSFHAFFTVPSITTEMVQGAEIYYRCGFQVREDFF